jgi:hypothetical protein
MAAVTGAVIAAGGLALAAKGQSDARKAANQAADAAKNSGVNVAQVTQQAHDQAIKNAYDSAALERELNPLAPQLRTQSLEALLAQMNGGQYDQQIQQSLFDQFNAPSSRQNVSAPAFNDYSQSDLSQQAQARALAELQLGGKLDTETANQVIRSSAARAGGFGNTLGLGRDLSARDLGLTSLGLAQQRLTTAGQFGQAQDAWTSQYAGAKNAYGLNAAQMELQNQQLALQEQQQRANLGIGLYGLGQQGFQRALQAAQLGQSIAQPVTGLDPASIANLAVGNSNQQGAAAQNAAALRGQAANGLAGLGGQLTGFGLNAAAAYSQPKVQPYKPFSQPAPGSLSSLNSRIFGP